jgi:hypothetical protein
MSQTTAATQLRTAFKLQVHKRLDTRTEAVQWRGSMAPTILNIDLVLKSRIIHGHNATALLSDCVAQTKLERADGNWQQILDQFCHSDISSVASLASEFANSILVSQQAPLTRQKNYRNWCAVVTWAVAHDCLGSIMPMSPAVLMAATMEWMYLGCTPHLLHGIWAAIGDRHRAFDQPSPLRGNLSIGRLKKSIGSIVGAPKQLKFPIQKEHLHAILALEPATLRALRDQLATAVATVCCLRVGEVAALQLCDVWYDFDACRSAQYKGTLAINIRKRKNDQTRKGHHPRIGRSAHAGNDIVYRLTRLQLAAGHSIAPGCAKRVNPAAACSLCPPLFPKTTNGGKRFTNEHCSRDMISRAIQATLEEIGVDTSRFSGISARKGGLSTAIDAGVPEPVLFLQSGHGQRFAARAYMQFQSATHLYATWAAFEL